MVDVLLLFKGFVRGFIIGSIQLFVLETSQIPTKFITFANYLYFYNRQRYVKKFIKQFWRLYTFTW